MHERWSLYGKALAAVGAILSLVFLGWEIRQNTNAVRGATYQSVIDAHNDGIALMIENPELSGLVGRYMTGDPTMTDPERGRARLMLLHQWRTIESAHYQYELGNLPEVAFRRWLPPTLADSAQAAWWTSVRDRFTPSFVTYVDSVMAAGDKQP